MQAPEMLDDFFIRLFKQEMTESLVFAQPDEEIIQPSVEERSRLH